MCCCWCYCSYQWRIDQWSFSIEATLYFSCSGRQNFLSVTFNFDILVLLTLYAWACVWTLGEFILWLVVDLPGNEVKELTFLTGASFHIFGMVVFENALFYSDWHTHSVYMVDMVTGDQETIATHLSRPTAVVIYHPASLKGIVDLEKMHCQIT